MRKSPAGGRRRANCTYGNHESGRRLSQPDLLLPPYWWASEVPITAFARVSDCVDVISRRSHISTSNLRREDYAGFAARFLNLKTKAVLSEVNTETKHRKILYPHVISELLLL